jgi:hypothetical protein
MATVFVVQSFRPGDIYDFIRRAVLTADPDATVFRADELGLRPGVLIIDSIYEYLDTADLVIVDISEPNSNVFYELGYIHGRGRSVIVIARTETIPRIPFDVRGMSALFYDEDLERLSSFVPVLAKTVGDALRDPKPFQRRPRAELSVNKVFLSYSHHDASFLARLHVHLRPLQKQGHIDAWVDTRIQAGDRWTDEITMALQTARIAILLVSADYLASDFIVDDELPPLLAKAESHGTRILPVILKPCRFTRDRHLSVFQAVNDPSKPISLLPEAEQELVFDKVAQAVEQAMLR